MDPQIRPTAIKAPHGARVFEVTWADGQHMSYPHEILRGYCPCAGCQGHSGAIRFQEGGNLELEDQHIDMNPLIDVCLVLLVFFGVAGTLSTIPILSALKDTKSPFTAFLLICGAWVFVAGYTSINAIVKAELFPTNVRALGVGLPYAITVSLFGGTAPALALYFKSLGHESWFYYYLSGIIFISLLIYTTMRDTKHASAMHRHE